MKCPHCAEGIHEAWANLAPLGAEDGSKRAAGDFWEAVSMVCPECGELIVQLVARTRDGTIVKRNFLAWPQHATRPVPPEVDEPFAEDFREACATLGESPKASAALSRRTLQTILREKAGIKKRNLDEEIQAAIDSKAVPTWISENLDAVRVVGNFAAHPIKSTNTGEIVDVEPGEAEFLLDVLEGLFDFYFVQPARAEAQRVAIDAKLQEAGKPPLKDAGGRG